jgi:hypothetical protein
MQLAVLDLISNVVDGTAIATFRGTKTCQLERGRLFVETGSWIRPFIRSSN